MPDPITTDRFARALTTMPGMIRPAASRREPGRRGRLVWLCGLVALGLALQTIAGLAGPSPAWPTVGAGPQSFGEALELDEDEPQFGLILSPVSVLPLHLASAPAPHQFISVTLTPLTPPPPSA